MPAQKATSELRTGSGSGGLLCRLWPYFAFGLVAHAAVAVLYPVLAGNVLPEPLQLPSRLNSGGTSVATATTLVATAGPSVPLGQQAAANPRSSSSSSSNNSSNRPAAWASSAGWLSEVYAAVPTKEALLVHQPFFWTELAATAHVRIGNFERDAKHGKKGFAKV
jgi:hypothetical protein